MNNNIDQKLKDKQSYFGSLQLMTPQFKDFLQQFCQPRSIEAFYDGVKKFMAVALLSTDMRQDFYGSRFGGLHYSEDLECLWRMVFPQITIPPVDFRAHTLPLWQFNLDQDCYALSYTGTQPSQALNQLIQGPAVIECGMFCQLSIWFGMRYVMGDVQFDEYFGNKPFYLTQYNLQEPTHTKPYDGTPLWPFLSKPRQPESHCLLIQYVYNVIDYPIKHPTGNARGHNCIIIDDRYYVLNGSFADPSGLSKHEVYELLLQSYNEPAQIDAKKYIASLRSNTNQLIECFQDFVFDTKIYKDPNLLFQYVLNRQAILQYHQFTFEQFMDVIQLEELHPGRNEHISSIMFDLDKFKQILPKRPALPFFRPAVASVKKDDLPSSPNNESFRGLRD